MALASGLRNWEEHNNIPWITKLFTRQTFLSPVGDFAKSDPHNPLLRSRLNGRTRRDFAESSYSRRPRLRKVLKISAFDEFRNSQ